MIDLTAPRVTVIVIFFNAERFLEEAIESVIAQMFRSWELLLVDDGSTDRSSIVARRYAADDPARVRYLHHPRHANNGMSASRNLGIRHARGEYLAFLDADDVWFADALKRQVEILDAHPEAAMVYGPIQWWFSWSGNNEDRDRDYVEELGVIPNTVIRPPTLLKRFLRDKAAVPSGILVRRSIAESVGGFEDNFRGEYEDQVFCAKICLRYPVFAASSCWYRYRQHRDACVYQAHLTGQTHAARRTFLLWLVDYLDRQQVTDHRLWWTIRFELWRFGRPTLFRTIRRCEFLLSRLRRRLGALLGMGTVGTRKHAG